MIPALIILLIRKIRRRIKHNAHYAIIISLVGLLQELPLNARSQDVALNYKISRNGATIGSMQLNKTLVSERVVIRLVSEIRTRFLVSFTAHAREEAVFENGKVVSSSVYRKLNGTERENRKLKAVGGAYRVETSDGTRMVDYFPIEHNMLSLYFNEPVNFSKVYSDSYQKYAQIKRLSDHHYRVDFPDGNYSEFFYGGGVCRTIKVHHTWYSATIDLINK